MGSNELVVEVKKKREFSGLPDSIVARVLEECDSRLDDKNRIKEARSKLRKFFGVFLTNRVLKGEGEDILLSHISSKFRDYDEFYEKIFEGVEGVKTVLDLGCGANGLSFGHLRDALGEVKYVGLEAAGQLVDKMNAYFDTNSYSGKAFCLDLMDSEAVWKVLVPLEGPRVVLMLQVIDALESMEKDYSKVFLEGLMAHLTKDDMVIITMPMSSISGRKKFEVGRKWLRDYLEEKFDLKDEFIVGNERVFRVKK
jgi:hypothetical protein